MATDDADYDVISGRVSAKRKWRIEHLLCRFTDNTMTAIQVLIGGDGEDYLLLEQRNPVVDTGYWYDQPFELCEGDWLIARFIEATEDDVLSFYFKGVELRRVG